MKNMKLIHQLHTVLNMIKGFTAGYTSSNKDQMLVEHEGAVYKVTLEYLGEGAVEEHIKSSL